MDSQPLETRFVQSSQLTLSQVTPGPVVWPLTSRKLRFAATEHRSTSRLCMSGLNDDWRIEGGRTG